MAFQGQFGCSATSGETVAGQTLSTQFRSNQAIDIVPWRCGPGRACRTERLQPGKEVTATERRAAARQCFPSHGAQGEGSRARQGCSLRFGVQEDPAASCEGHTMRGHGGN